MKFCFLILIIIMIAMVYNCSDEKFKYCVLYKGYGDYLVVDAVQQMIEQRLMSFTKGEYDKGSVTVYQLLCSPDTTKIFSIVTVNQKDKEENPYFSTCIIGNRFKGDNEWIFTEFSFILSYNNTPISAANVLCSYYFNQLKGDWQTDEKYTFDSSPLEKEFWNSLIFRKGVDIDSLYYYQTDYNTYTRKHDKIKPMVTCIMK